MSDFRLIAKNPPGFLHPGIAIAASRAGALGVLDLTLTPAPERVGQALLDLHRYGREQCGIRISTLFDDLDGDFLESLPDWLGTLIVETESEETVRRLVELSAQKGLELLVETVDLDSAKRAAQAGAAGIIVKGHEAGGKIGEETSLVLLQRLASNLEIPFYIQGGISPHTAAACSVGGGAGVVLDWQLALAREAELPEAWRQQIARFDGGETIAVGGDLGDLFRVVALPGSAVLSEVRALEASLADENMPADKRIGRWRDSLRDRAQADRADERLVLLGQEASMAVGLAERYRTVGGILKAVGEAVVSHRRDAAALRPLATHSRLARSQGTRFPIAQGPMTRVSDNPAFALEVAKAGGLPFMALSVLRENTVRRLLEETQHLLGDYSWGVGILGFVPLDLRVEQLKVVREIRPRYALIAGGRPDQALELEEEGISTYLHVPSPGLLELFLNQGSRKFVFEGRECGGHVGPRTSFVLWSSMIDLLLSRLSDTELAECQVLFAGGIHDARSSAIVATLAAPLAARGVGIGALMGTAYLFTREAVETGAIVPGFQKAALSCQRTVTLESAPGHATRATDSPFSHTFMKTRKELLSRGVAGDEIQRTLEELNLGRLRIASKGIERVDADAESDGQQLILTVNEQEQNAKGLYMIGQVAALRHEPCTMEELHRDVSERGSELLDSATAAPEVSIPRNRSERPCDVAIVGMSCLFPKAQSIRAYWSNILHKVDAVTEVPRERWDWRDYYDSDRKTRDRVYSK